MTKNKIAILVSSAIISLGAVIALAAAGDLWILNGSSMYSTSTVSHVGIGTATPATPLDVVGSGASILRLKSTGNYPYIELVDWAGYINSISQAGGEVYLGSGHSGAYAINFRNGWDVNMRLDGNGNLGIGTTTPSSIMHIVDSNATTTLTVGGGNSPACLKLRDADNAGWTYCSFLNGTMACSVSSCQ